MTIIIEIIVCLSFIFLIYYCCAKGRAHRQRYQGNDVRGGEGPQGVRMENVNNEDLRRFRERMLSERGGGTTTTIRRGQNDANNNNAAATASSLEARKSLIEKNLFDRVISREESVGELRQLLAISRGGGVDEELGRCCAASSVSTAAVSGGDHSSVTAASTDVADTFNGPQVSSATVAEGEESLPLPSAPPTLAGEEEIPRSQGAATDATTTTIAAAAVLPSTSPPIIGLEPIRNLWSNLTHYNDNNSQRRGLGSESEEATVSCQQQQQTNEFSVHKLECSICLDPYSPNDAIAWAKDGGDPPPSSSGRGGANARNNTNNNDTGCDHIFHRECLVSWLMEHDDCPLCRRTVVHVDAEVRFAGWDGMG